MQAIANDYDDDRAFPMGVIFEGTAGKVLALCGGLSAEPQSLLSTVIRPQEIRLKRPRGHVADFVHCVKTREQTAAPVEAPCASRSSRSALSRTTTAAW